MNFEFLTIYHSKFKGNRPYIGHCLVGISTLIIIDYNRLIDRKFG